MDLQLLANEVLLALKDRVQHLKHPYRLLIVALLRARHILGVELAEPDRLAKVRALAGHLEVQVLLQQPLLRVSRERELVLLVVALDNVLDDGARLPQDEVVVVGVLDGRQAPVGVDLEKGRLLGVLDGDGLVGDGELLEGDEDLARVGALACVRGELGDSGKWKVCHAGGEGVPWIQTLMGFSPDMLSVFVFSLL